MLKRIYAAVAAVAFFWLIGTGEVAPLPGSLSAVHAGDAKLKFEIYPDAKMEYRWRLKGAEDKVLATGGQSFSSKAVARKSVEGMMKNLDKRTFEVYEDKSKGQRWRLKATNGQVVASSGGAYATKEDCEKAIDTIKKGVAKAEVVEEKAKEK